MLPFQIKQSERSLLGADVLSGDLNKVRERAM